MVSFITTAIGEVTAERYLPDQKTRSSTNSCVRSTSPGLAMTTRNRGAPAAGEATIHDAMVCTLPLRHKLLSAPLWWSRLI